MMRVCLILHPAMNQCPIHYATTQKSPTYHRSAIDPATTAIAEADGHLLANFLCLDFQDEPLCLLFLFTRNGEVDTRLEKLHIC